MNFQEFRVAHPDVFSGGKTVWICDFRFNDVLEKPIRHVQPTEVTIVDNSELPKGKKVYYSDVFFRPVGTKKAIGPYDNTGYRSYPGTSVQVFLSERECREKYWAMCTDIIRLLGERAMFVTRVLSEKKIEVLKDLQANGFMAVESSED